MKIKRYKHARRHLGFYKNVFNFREPHLVLVDGTFTCVALRHQTNIKDQLPKYLDGEVQLLTTKCAILETESLGKELYGAASILRRYRVLSCPHQEEPVAAADCIKGMIGDNNSHHYYIATQDPELSECTRGVPGTPLLYMNMNAIVLEKPSQTSQDHAVKLTQQRVATVDYQWDALKRLTGPQDGTRDERRPRRRRAKEPNPLSVKKKKKKATQKVLGEAGEGPQKASRRRRRRRSKLTAHVQEQSRSSEVS
ncbi:rRNA-processing protein UTP23 homolog [Acanthaster planci]|uniref:rRNA-processing protein UTP23 homolog n=1 Tax=Acanthaster planci TaxID=133434 RepID=A0A8B7Y9X0_ACAPL|nr:rRNA-processing protein UTP23 homolog [Acanthaster planci]